ncbi:hypothetical protein DAEQUDRAFT_497948 [Daedalea quercina L-15889]|uniref:Uncharacterized protein n=1 Tax=Daedalea quercina L-15889 TaxID=1314783 RepID=A0A165MLR0_9APHY|nr:hypothetical protein DAEQUDRAFT_497948 [Daedalea quercina L-15889]
MLGSWQHCGRHLARILGPFINLHNVLLCGIHYYGIDDEEWDLTKMKGMDIDEIDRHVGYFERLLFVIPELDTIFDRLVECVIAARYISNFLERHMKQARSDDGTNVKKNILRFLPSKPDFPALRIDHEKVKRGFNHIITGRHLCPASLLPNFDNSPQHFCEEALAGRVQITADYLPAFAYPEGAYNPAAADEHALKSPIIASVSQTTP